MNEAIQKLVNFALNHSLIKQSDVVYATNRLLDILGLEIYAEVECNAYTLDSPQELLDEMLEYLIESKQMKDTQNNRDVMDAKIMDCLTPHPSSVIETFQINYNSKPELATTTYYNFSIATNYIRSSRIKNDKRWVVPTTFGELDISINLSKPEKDPKDIAAAKTLTSSTYPKCLLCIEQEGYAGIPGRSNHRLIPIKLSDKDFFLQYSPYSYYNEHCIVLNKQHIPMVIDKMTFSLLLDFVDYLPHYFVGSNADLPIVGGSILTHEHFQGGNFEFAMERAEMLEQLTSKTYEGVTFGRVLWPMSVIRVQSTDKVAITKFATDCLSAWKVYDNEALDILSKTYDVHNTITPIARKHGDVFEMDLVLRNNRVSEEHPDGIFHPHKERHHIKKENIGLIEVMGLAILPARLKQEIEGIEDAFYRGEDHLPNHLKLHENWFKMLREKYKFIMNDEVDTMLTLEIGQVFLHVLEDAGVFKQDIKGQTALLDFVSKIGD